MKKFEYIDISTADVAFIAYGKDLNELFSNSALAMYGIMVDVDKIEEKIEKEIMVEGYDLESLMFNWLNELLYITDTEKLVFKNFDIKIDEKNFKLFAKCKGEEISEKHNPKTVVKAATYHLMKIQKNDIWKVQVILDI
jgi:SHS2 domain-containing protein